MGRAWFRGSTSNKTYLWDVKYNIPTAAILRGLQKGTELAHLVGGGLHGQRVLVGPCPGVPVYPRALPTSYVVILYPVFLPSEVVHKDPERISVDLGGVLSGAKSTATAKALLAP
jgi:hypothetical protein